MIIFGFHDPNSMIPSRESAPPPYVDSHQGNGTRAQGPA